MNGHVRIRLNSLAVALSMLGFAAGTGVAAAAPAAQNAGAPTASSATSAPAPETGQVGTPAEKASAAPADALVPSSNEQGQTPLDESFATPTHDEWVRETRRQAWEDTKWDVQIRSFYLDRDKYDDSESEAWALGGSVGFKTGYFRERFAFGATGYTSQKLHGPEDKDGTTLLKPGQESYTVLGEIYGEFLINKDNRISIGRRGIDTPYLNRNDARMTPNTFESITLQGLYEDENRGSEWRYGGGYFDEIKERNSDEFVSMAEDAGAPEGVERGVYVAGVNYKSGGFSLGAIDYYSDDIINIFYTEAKYAMPVSEDAKWQFAVQYSDETSTGDDLLRGNDFDSHQWGVKAEFGYRGALFTTAYTSAGGGTNMQNPWSGYPGYTSVQVEDFNRDGEDAWMLRAGYSFESLKGLSVYGLYVDGSDPDSATEYAKSEADFNIQWAPPEGILKGLMMRLRYAQVEQDAPGSSDLKDLRIMIFYDPPSL